MEKGSIPCTCSHRIALLHSDGKLRMSSLGLFAAQVRHLFSHPSIIHIRMHTHLPTHLLPALPPHPRTNIPTLPQSSKQTLNPLAQTCFATSCFSYATIQALHKYPWLKYLLNRSNPHFASSSSLFDLPFNSLNLTAPFSSSSTMM